MQLLQRRKKGRSHPAERQHPANAMLIDCLDVDLLQRILANLDQEQRVKTVPLVCRAWRDAAKAPSVMWERVRLSLTVLGAAQILGSEVSGEVHHPCKLAPWLAARARSIHTLFICILNDAAALHMTEGLLLASLPQLPALRELHIFSTGVLDSRSLSLLASLSRAHCKLQEVSLAFSPHQGFVPADLGVLERISTLTSLSIDLHAAARHIRASSANLPQWHAELPRGLCNLPKLAELDLSFRAFQQPELFIPQAFTQLTSLKKLRLDSCGQLRCHPDVSRGLMRQLDDISLRQCRLGSLGCLDVLLGLRTLREVRIEDCTSDSGAEPAPWEDTMRLMPPLLELADMFNIILRRCRNSRADSDLVRAGSRLQRMLHARCNQLSALPSSLSSAWHCCPSRLTLRYCGLRYLPGGQYVKTVTVLDLEGNNFRAIPEALRGAKQLSHLDLSCNHDLQIGLQDVHILLQLHSLSILDLSKVSERLPLEGPPLPNEVLPYWTKASLQNLAAVVCWRHAASLNPASIRVTQSADGGRDADQELSTAFSCSRTPDKIVPLEVSVMLLGAPWLSASCIKYASIKEAGKITFDMDATCDAYIKTVLNIMSPGARQAMSRKARRAAAWRRMTWAEFKGGVSSFFGQLMHRLRLQQR